MKDDNRKQPSVTAVECFVIHTHTCLANPIRTFVMNRHIRLKARCVAACLFWTDTHDSVVRKVSMAATTLVQSPKKVGMRCF